MIALIRKYDVLEGGMPRCLRQHEDDQILAFEKKEMCIRDSVKSMIDKMGGSIEVSSREGEGSEFVITLPLSLIHISYCPSDGGGRRRKRAAFGVCADGICLRADCDG